MLFFKGNIGVLAIKEINRGFDFQAGFANKFGATTTASIKHLPSEIATEYLASSFMRLRLKSRNFADANEIICCHFFVNQGQGMNFEVTGHWRARLLFSREFDTTSEDLYWLGLVLPII
jgi:hypothetical protein